MLIVRVFMYATRYETRYSNFQGGAFRQPNELRMLHVLCREPSFANSDT